MKVLFPGHHYQMRVWPPRKGGPGSTPLPEMKFTGKEEGAEHDGVTTQENLRVLIDRTFYCDTCLPSHLNDYIIYHLRMALVLHEARALMRKVEKGELKPELVGLGDDGHFALQEAALGVSPYASEPRKRETDTGGPQPGFIKRCAAFFARSMS